MRKYVAGEGTIQWHDKISLEYQYLIQPQPAVLQLELDQRCISFYGVACLREGLGAEEGFEVPGFFSLRSPSNSACSFSIVTDCSFS
jgi:hypothetical protein